MYNMDEFYEFHGISRAHFAKLIGIAYPTLMKYEAGGAVREDIKLRIEIGMQIMEDYALRYHDHRWRRRLNRPSSFCATYKF